MLRAFLVASALLAGCGSDDRPPGVSGEHPHGMTAPMQIGGQRGSAGAVARVGVVREIPSLMRWPSAGDTAPPDVTVNAGGLPLVVRDGRFDTAGYVGWFGIERGGVRVLASVDAIGGELTLPVLQPTATGLPRSDRAAVVFQLTDALGEPISGVTASDKPGVIGPCYDNSDDVVRDVPRTTNKRGAVAYLEIPLTSPQFETKLFVGGQVVVAQVPIVAGTVTFLRTSIQ